MSLGETPEGEKLGRAEYLGMEVPGRTTSRYLGLEFDKWVRHANKAYNSFLDSGNPDHLDKIRGVVGEYYRKMAQLHSVEASPEQRSKTWLELGDFKIPSELIIFGLTPDGVFLRGKKSAIFESKLSKPHYAEFPYEMALYAIAIERSHPKQELDSAIILYSDYPTGKHLTTAIHHILDSHISEITLNADRFLRLIQASRIRREGTIPDKIRRQFRIHYGSWKSFFVRPEGVPEPSERKPCPSCPFQQKCYKQGGGKL